MNLIKAILFCFLFTSVGVFSQTSVIIPNVFTPDGDERNDIFSITSEGFAELTCTIYNRNGEVVYRFFGLNGNWDGYTHAGILVTPGVYFVFVEVSTSDGTSETRQGTLQVIY